MSLAICGRRIEIIHSVFNGIVNKSVHSLLVYLVFAFPCAFAGNCGSAHAAVAENGNLVACFGIDAVGHFILGNGTLCRCRFAVHWIFPESQPTSIAEPDTVAPAPSLFQKLAPVDIFIAFCLHKFFKWFCAVHDLQHILR